MTLMAHLPAPRPASPSRRRLPPDPGQDLVHGDEFGLVLGLVERLAHEAVRRYVPGPEFYESSVICLPLEISLADPHLQGDHPAFPALDGADDHRPAEGARLAHRGGPLDGRLDDLQRRADGPA